MTQRTHLLIIDPQNDFCDLPPAWCPADPVHAAPLAPALPVPGAHADMLRLADFIGSHGQAIDEITITLDSHHRIDIAHPPFWRRADGGAVAPFTPITAAQVRRGDFAPRDAAAMPRVLAYLDALQARGRYTLMVWPVHCQIGSWGHAVHAAVQAACNGWEEQRLRPVHCVHKGSNPWTEHYSAVQAEVPLADDDATQPNRALLERLDRATRILVAGEAGSHCVRATTEDLVALLPGARPERLVLLEDAISPVTGFEAEQAAFITAMRDIGVRSECLDQAASRLAAAAQ